MRLPSTALAALALTACTHSTQYEPIRKDRATITVVKNQLAIHKNGQSRPITEAANGLVDCDSDAAQWMKDSHAQQRSGERLVRVGGMLNAVVPFVPIAAAVAVPLLITGQTKLEKAAASYVDAINRHNDADACRLASTTPVATIEGASK